MCEVVDIFLDQQTINPIYVEPEVSDCRICLEDGGNLISICGCSGTSEYVHKECIENWINRFPSDHPNHFKCQICDQNYKLDLVDEKRFTTCERNVLTFIYLFFIIIGLTIVILIIGMV